MRTKRAAAAVAIRKDARVIAFSGFGLGALASGFTLLEEGRVADALRNAGADAAACGSSLHMFGAELLGHCPACWAGGAITALGAALMLEAARTFLRR